MQAKDGSSLQCVNTSSNDNCRFTSHNKTIVGLASGEVFKNWMRLAPSWRAAMESRLSQTEIPKDSTEAEAYQEAQKISHFFAYSNKSLAKDALLKFSGDTANKYVTLDAIRRQYPNLFARAVYAANAAQLPLGLLLQTVDVESGYYVSSYRCNKKSDCDADFTAGLGHIRHSQATSTWSSLWGLADTNTAAKVKVVTKLLNEAWQKLYGQIAVPESPGKMVTADLLATAFYLRSLADFIGLDLKTASLKLDGRLDKYGYQLKPGDYIKAYMLLRVAYQSGPTYLSKRLVKNNFNKIDINRVRINEAGAYCLDDFTEGVAKRYQMSMRLRFAFAVAADKLNLEAMKQGL